jgi:hypothetical protein
MVVDGTNPPGGFRVSVSCRRGDKDARQARLILFEDVDSKVSNHIMQQMRVCRPLY